MTTNATNETINYGLPKFIATDKPAWLVDWNNTMDELDSLIKGVSDAVNTNTDNITQLTENVDTLNETVGDTESGIVKNVNDLLSTIGDSNSGLVKQIADMQADLISQNALITNLETRVTALENA